MLALKRMRRRAGLFVAVFGVVLLLAGLGVGLSEYLGASAETGVRAGVSALTGADGGFAVSIPLPPAAAAQRAQDARVRATVRDAVRADGRAVPMRIDRDIVTANEVELDRDGQAPIRSALASITGLQAGAELTSGSWPTGPGEASMQADAAAALGVRTGDHLTLPGGAVVTVSGIWRVRHPSDSRWLDDPITLNGVDPDVYSTRGWLVVDPALWSRITVDPVARWTIRPQPDRIGVAQLGALQRSPDTVSTALQKADRTQDIEETGLLQVALRPIQQNAVASTAVSTAPLVVVAVLGVVTLIELARMLDQLRAAENALVRARGASRRRVVIGAAVEGAIVALPAAAIGGGFTAWWVSRAGAAHDVPAIGWAAAVAAAVTAVAALAASAGRTSRDTRPPRASRRPGLVRGGARLRSTVAIGAVALLTLLAVVAVSQFLLYGSPLAPVAGGGSAVDPLAVSALALAIAALGVLAVAAFPAIARALERSSRRVSSLDALPLRQLARRSRAALTPILLVAFAVSGLVVAAGYAGTWEVSAGQTRAVQIGTPLRVVSVAPLVASITSPVAGQSAAAPVARDDVQLGDSLVTMIAAPSSRLVGSLSAIPGAVDPALLAQQLESKVVRPVLPRSSTGLILQFTATPATAAPASAEVTLVDAAGAEQFVQLVEPVGTTALRADLPTGLAPWAVHAIDVVMPEAEAGTNLEVALRASGPGAAAVDIPLGGDWKPAWGDTPDPRIVGLGGSQAGLHVAVASPGGHVLLQPLPGNETRLPIVISRKLAQDTGLAVDSNAAMVLVTRGGTVPVRVVGISPVIPGVDTGEGVLVDLASMQDAADREGLLHLSAGEWWVGTRSPVSAAAQVSARAPAGTVVQTQRPTATDRVLESARDVVWIAGVAAALLALLTVAAGLFAELRGRRDEVAVLRAVGVSPRSQARARVIEWALLLALGILAGLIDGVLVSALLVPDLARAAIPNAIAELRTYLALDLPGAAIAAGAVLAAVAVLLLVVARTVRRQAR